jgi:hypothetical protein
MTIETFLQTLHENREMVGAPLMPRSTCCPLYVVIFAACDEDVHYQALFDRWGNHPTNPDPAAAEEALGMPEAFVAAIAQGYDHGLFYGDDEDFYKEFAGFLIGATLRPAPRELGA